MILLRPHSRLTAKIERAYQNVSRNSQRRNARKTFKWNNVVIRLIRREQRRCVIVT